MFKNFALWGSIVGGLEVILRAIPTKKMCAPLGVAINVLNAVSNFLNNGTTKP
jgi:hypothetical protein